MWQIKCGQCGTEKDAELFLTPQKNRFACPACGSVWRIEQQGRPVVTESGFVIPPKKVCILEPQLQLAGRC